MSTTYQSTESGTFTPRTYESDADARSPLEYDREHVNALLAGRDGNSTPSVRRTAIQAGRVPDPEDGSLCFECEMRHRVEARIAEHEEVLSGMERKLEVMGMNEEGREGREKKTREMIEDSVGRAMAAFSASTGKGEKGQREKMQAPIRLKDAVGRKFIFPFHMANTWMGVEELIKQAFLPVDVLGPHVQQGHYDLVCATGEIILPQVWEVLVEPGWEVTMHMWPLSTAERPPGAPSGPQPDQLALPPFRVDGRFPSAVRQGPSVLDPSPGSAYVKEVSELPVVVQPSRAMRNPPPRSTAVGRSTGSLIVVEHRPETEDASRCSVSATLNTATERTDVPDNFAGFATESETSSVYTDSDALSETSSRSAPDPEEASMNEAIALLRKVLRAKRVYIVGARRQAKGYSIGLPLKDVTELLAECAQFLGEMWEKTRRGRRDSANMKEEDLVLVDD